MIPSKPWIVEKTVCKTVYHSLEWDYLVENGFITKTVGNPSITGQNAIMFYCGV
jgi:hypothetical protein